jgi:hypothetical protein
LTWDEERAWGETEGDVYFSAQMIVDLSEYLFVRPRPPHVEWKRLSFRLLFSPAQLVLAGEVLLHERVDCSGSGLFLSHPGFLMRLLGFCSQPFDFLVQIAAVLRVREGDRCEI